MYTIQRDQTVKGWNGLAWAFSGGVAGFYFPLAISSEQLKGVVSWHPQLSSITFRPDFRSHAANHARSGIQRPHS